MLEILTADEAGFCFGVERAINITKNAVQDTDQKVYTLGPLIHNPQVVKNLKKSGIDFVNDIDQIDQGVLIVRTHGVEPSILKKATDKGIKLIDATCPYVKNAHIYANKLINNDYQTFIFGDKNHPEVKGIFGHTDSKGIVIESIEDLKKIDIKSKVGLVAQTTQSYDQYFRIIKYLIPEVKELKVFNTICNTTGKRQKSARQLAKKVDAMLVIGGYNSANTKRLAEICSKTNTPTFHIETVEQINWDKIKDFNKIGITAGASTPDWIIKEVLEIMAEEKKDVNVEKEEDLKVDEVKEEKQKEEQPVKTVQEKDVEVDFEDSEETTKEDKDEEVKKDLKEVED
ncbi:MAG: 4-hydroxy-3-methylbut-2-enyl diphosphate reductase, partial [Halanaerobiales bacterium]|nr:4-hydroxy-3-methylbut-2-enyl diphosphate reductase [Halanaerobiales bacterium]